MTTAKHALQASDGSSEKRARGLFVLENMNGETVRSFQWESSKIFVIFRHDNRRLETVASVKDLEERQVSFELLHESTPSQLKKKSLEIKGAGRIRWVEETDRFSQMHALANEPVMEKKKLLGWSFGIQLGLLLAAMLAGLSTSRKPQGNKEYTVSLIPKSTIEHILSQQEVTSSRPVERAIKRPFEQPIEQREKPIVSRAETSVIAGPSPKKKVVVVPSETKITKRSLIPTRSTSLSSVNKNTRYRQGVGGGHKGPGRKGYGTAEPSMNQIGALGALTSVARSKGGNGGRGGLNLQAVGTEPGSGSGGKGFGGFGNEGGGGRGRGGLGRGKGMGLSNAMYGRGLIAAPFGDGSPAPGTGGYGTRGRAGGGAQGAGYGEETVVGSWKGTGPKGIGPAGSGSGSGRETGSPWVLAQGDGDEVVVQGGLDRDQIAEVITRHLGQITYCYEQGLQKQPSLSGRVAVRFQINGTGRIQTAQVYTSSLHSTPVESCIVNKLKTWKFPKPHGGVNVAVTYPFVLRRVSQR